jgi:lysyl-tRNA synthetase class 2
MLEWYPPTSPTQAVIDDCLALLRLAAETAGTRVFAWRGSQTDPFAEPERMTVAAAFERFAGVDLLETLDGGEADRDALAAQSPVHFTADDSWSDIFSRILVEEVEPNLGVKGPTVLYEYPAAEAALARTCAHDRRVAERFELYACGVELANGFGELTDPAEQRRRFEAEMDIKQRVYGERYPIDEECWRPSPDAARFRRRPWPDRLIMLPAPPASTRSSGRRLPSRYLRQPAPGGSTAPSCRPSR